MTAPALGRRPLLDASGARRGRFGTIRRCASGATPGDGPAGRHRSSSSPSPLSPAEPRPDWRRRGPGLCLHGDGPKAGLTATTVFGGKDANRYLLETTGTGVALFDYDGDGRLDVFFVNGTTLEGFPRGPGAHQSPLPQPRRRDVRGRHRALRARRSGWGQGVCAGDYDNDGREDLYVTYYGQNRLFRNRGDGGFDGRDRQGGSARQRRRAGARAARSSTTTATAGSTSSPPTTSTSTSPPRPRPTAACAATRA